MTKTLRQRGFTLLEILIALAVFAIMSMMAYAGLAAILDASEATKPRSQQMAQLQAAWYFLNDDLNQVIDRPIRDELGGNEPAFGGGRGNEILVFTRRNPVWSSTVTNNSIKRISYSFENGILYRQVWALADRTPETQFRRKKLLTAERVDVKFYNEDSQSWLSFTGTKSGIPKALEVNIGLPRMGSVRRLFLIRQ